MAIENPAGYAYFIEHFGLQVKPLSSYCSISSSVNARTPTGKETLFPSRAQPGDSIERQLEFALKNEGINLEVWAALIDSQWDLVAGAITEWNRRQSTSAYARRSAFLFEWLSHQRLVHIADVSAGGYIDLMDADQFVVSNTPIRDRRFRVNNNLLGNQQFCPVIRKTDKIKSLLNSNLQQDLERTQGAYSPDLWERANEWFLLDETKSSFNIEKESPNESKARRFYKILHEAGSGPALDDDLLIGVQNAVVEKRMSEAYYRNDQNWLGQTGRIGQFRATYIPPSPGDLIPMMEGWKRWVHDSIDEHRLHPIMLAAAASFGFVYLHPFMDGNGRTHRFLIHDILARTGFFTKGTLIPVSAYMLGHLPEYSEVLKAVSAPVMSQLEYRIIGEYADSIEVKSPQPAWLYRYWDATDSVEFIFDAISHSVRVDMAEELERLNFTDIATKRINDAIDMPNRDCSLLVTMIEQNGGELSKRKRARFFYLTDDKLHEVEQIVREVFPRAKHENGGIDDGLDEPESPKAPATARGSRLS